MNCQTRIGVKFGVATLLLLACFFVSGCNDQGEGDSGTLDYSIESNWVRLPKNTSHAVDVFYAYPTVYMDSNPPNMSVNDSENRQAVVDKTNEQMGLYSPMTNIFVPYYRQMYRDGFNDLPADQAQALLDVAYNDVEAAFDYYLEHYNNGRPFILVGHSQGAGIVVDLLRKRFDDESIAGKMVAAYTTGVSIMPDDLQTYPWLNIAQSATDTGVVIVYNTLDYVHYESSSFAQGTLCVNPLLWSNSTDYAPASLNKGAVWTDSNGVITKEIPEFTDAQIRYDGALAVTSPNPDDYYDPDRQPYGSYHDYDQVFFYRNLQENVQDRIDAFLAK